jgi:hypothetical protein
MSSRNDAVSRACPRPDPFHVWPQTLANRVRQFICAVHGHDWRLRGKDNRLYLCCAWCDRETPGWTLDHPMMSLARSPVLHRIGATAVRKLESPDTIRSTTERSLSERSTMEIRKELPLRLVTRMGTRTEAPPTAAVHQICRRTDNVLSLKDSVDLPTLDDERLHLKGAVAECAQPGSR